ncbi:hypothetical protein ABW19_dt0201639 [Dactylella cylindrospora]|nr:hypothetical protein ABW19_dt0201639 [Dactylella cylindrospora]
MSGVSDKHGFPDSIYNAYASSTDLSPIPQYGSYSEYLRQAEKTYTDIEHLNIRLDSDTKYKPVDLSRTATYAIDIGQFGTPIEDYSFSIRGHSPINDRDALNNLLVTATPGTKLRVLFFYHRPDEDVGLFYLAQFYDINPRIIRDHSPRSTVLSIHDTSPPYMPSEASFSPIQLFRSIATRGKRTNIILASNPNLDFKTVLVFICQGNSCYSQNVVNRDILYPTQYMSPDLLGNWCHPRNDAETCFLRLCRLNSDELAACVSQPILTILPLVRTFALEASQDLLQLRKHLFRCGLGEAGQETEAITNRKPENHWGPSTADPFETFQWVNDRFLTSFNSLNDHVGAPWLDFSASHLEYASRLVATSMADVKRVRNNFTELREMLKEFSAHVAAKESIHEARRSVAQAESVNQLTRLAFIFIPLTFASSLFGMNIREWQDTNIPQFKWFIVTAISCTTLTTVLAMLFARWAPTVRGWILEYHGMGRAILHFFMAWTVRILLTIVITIPGKIREYVRNRRIRKEQEKMEAV